MKCLLAPGTEVSSVLAVKPERSANSRPRVLLKAFIIGFLALRFRQKDWLAGNPGARRCMHSW
jgi:hypothetical protein